MSIWKKEDERLEDILIKAEHYDFLVDRCKQNPSFYCYTRLDFADPNLQFQYINRETRVHLLINDYMNEEFLWTRGINKNTFHKIIK